MRVNGATCLSELRAAPGLIVPQHPQPGLTGHRLQSIRGQVSKGISVVRLHGDQMPGRTAGGAALARNIHGTVEAKGRVEGGQP